MSDEYLKYLDRALDRMPKKESSKERFEVTKPSCSIFGPKTVVFNFNEICSKMNREPNHVLKFLSKEMATATSLDGTRAIFKGRFFEQNIAKLLTVYCDKYVICPICKKPDTKIKKEERFQFLVCEACGARSSITLT